MKARRGENRLGQVGRRFKKSREVLKSLFRGRKKVRELHYWTSSVMEKKDWRKEGPKRGEEPPSSSENLNRSKTSSSFEFVLTEREFFERGQRGIMGPLDRLLKKGRRRRGLGINN